MSECCPNVLKGNVPLNTAQKVKLSRHKHNLRKLLTKKASIKASKKILQRGGFLVPWLLLYLAYLAAFLMEHAKKIDLVDPPYWSSLKIVIRTRKLLKRKHCRPAEKKVTSASNLEIESILSDNTISDDQKMKIYYTALNRYLSGAKSLEMPWFAPVLGTLFKMGETTVITPPAAVEEKEA